MQLFGMNITKAESSGGRNIPLETTASPWERTQGLVSHDNYAALMGQYKNWVYVGVFKNAVAVARYPLKLYARKKNKVSKIISKHRDVDSSFTKYLENSAHLRKFTINSDAVVEIVEHPILDLLNKVNPQMNRFDLFSKTEMFLELAGNAYWYLVLNGLGLPEQIWPLSPENMKVRIKESGSTTGEFIDGYTLTRGVEKIQFRKEEIIHFTLPSPYSNIYGMGPVAAGQESITFDHRSREYENVLLQNQCRPDVILQTDKKIGDVDHKTLIGRIRNAFAGRRGLGKWLLLDQGLTATPLNLPLREMGFIQGRKASKEEIAGILGVPVSKLTTEDVNLANASIGEIQYIRDTIAPRLTSIEEKLNEVLVPMFDENLFLTYGEVIPTDKNYRLMELEKHLTTKYSSINEERKIDGKDPVEWGDKPVEAAPPGAGGVPPASEATAEEANPTNPFETAEIPAIKSKHWIDQEAENDLLADDILSRVLLRLQKA